MLTKQQSKNGTGISIFYYLHCASTSSIAIYVILCYTLWVDISSSLLR